MRRPRGRARWVLPTYTPSVSLTRLLWAAAVVLAVVVVGTAYLGRGDGETTSTVVVAKRLIPAGTFVRPSMYDIQTVPQDEVEAGTLTDLRVLAMHHVARPIYPGERFTTSDFSPRRGRPRADGAHLTLDSPAPRPFLWPQRSTEESVRRAEGLVRPLRQPSFGVQRTA
jgi:hypothetical protein